MYSKTIKIVVSLIVSIFLLSGHCFGQEENVKYHPLNENGLLSYRVNYLDGINGQKISMKSHAISKFYRPSESYERLNRGYLEIELINVKGLRRNSTFIVRDESINCFEDCEKIIDANWPGSFGGKQKRNAIIPINEKVNFRVGEKGKGRIEINFEIEKNESIEACRNCKLTVEYELPKINSKVLPIPADPILVTPPYEADWQALDKQDFDSICTHLTKYPRGQYDYEAKKIMRSLDDNKWNNLRYSNDISDFQHYLSTYDNCRYYRAIYRAEAENKIYELEELQRIKEEWSRFSKVESDEEKIVSYISECEYSENRKKALTYLKNNFLELEVTNIEKDNAFMFTIENPYFNPRFKNLSLDDGIAIDYSSWKSDHILNIQVLEDGEYKILMQDSLGREATMAFGNTFEVELSNMDSAYVVNILGGKPPYAIELRNHESQHVDSFMTEKNIFHLLKDEMVGRDFIGEYSVTVSYNKGPKPIEVDEPIHFVRKLDSTKMLIFLLAGVGFLIAFFLIRYLSKSSKQPQTIFNT